MPPQRTCRAPQAGRLNKEAERTPLKHVERHAPRSLLLWREMDHRRREKMGTAPRLKLRGSHSLYGTQATRPTSSALRLLARSIGSRPRHHSPSNSARVPSWPATRLRLPGPHTLPRPTPLYKHPQDKMTQIRAPTEQPFLLLLLTLALHPLPTLSPHLSPTPSRPGIKNKRRMKIRKTR